MLAVRADLADRVSQISKRRGTLFDFINDVLEQAIRADEMGYTLKEINDDVLILKAAKEAGFAIFPERLIYEVIERVYADLKKELQRLWYETGEWYGKYCGDILRFEDMMRKILWNVSSFEILKADKGVAELVYLCSDQTESYTNLMAYFFEGALSALGYRSFRKNVSKGIINLDLKEAKGK